MEEIWKKILNYEGLYEVSNYGRIKSLPRKKTKGGRLTEEILSPSPSISGYVRVTLRKNGIRKTKMVHILVLEAFVSSKPEKKECAHLDSNPSNNNLSNLAWVSKEENEHHKIKNGTSNRGEKCHTSKITEDTARKIKTLHKNDPLLLRKEIARKLSVPIGIVNQVLGGYSWKHVNPE